MKSQLGNLRKLVNIQLLQHYNVMILCDLRLFYKFICQLTHSKQYVLGELKRKDRPYV